MAISEYRKLQIEQRDLERKLDKSVMERSAYRTNIGKKLGTRYQYGLSHSGHNQSVGTPVNNSKRELTPDERLAKTLQKRYTLTKRR